MRTTLVLIIILGLSKVDESTGKDVLLSSFYLSKATVPLLFLPEALDDGDKVLMLDMGFITVMTVPALRVLYQRWLGNPENVGLWRKINLGIDLVLAGSTALYGIYLTSTYEPNPYRSYDFNVGGLYIVGSVLYGLISLVETIPFSSESPSGPNLSMTPLFSHKSKTAGFDILYHY